MGNTIRVILLALCFSSCGWFEGEDVRGMDVNNEYVIYYDLNSVAFENIEIVSTEGSPLLQNCTEFFTADKSLYAKKSEDTIISYFKIKNSYKKPVEIDSAEYSRQRNRSGVTLYNYDDLTRNRR